MKAKTQKPVDRKKQLKFIYSYLKNHKMAVLASSDAKGSPQAALVGIAVNEKLEILCTTFSTSRKYENIKKNPKVALVVGSEKATTLQYEGVVEEIDVDKAEKDPLFARLEKIHSIATYVQREFEVFYRIKPKWIRYTNMAKEPWERFEITF